MAEISPLRRRMIGDMMIRNLSPATQQSYLYAVAKFSRHFGQPAWAGGGAGLPAALDCAAAIVGAYQSSSVRPAIFLRRHLGPDRRSRTHRRRPRTAEAAGGAERRGDRAVFGGGSRSAQPGGADDGLRGGPACRRGRAPDHWRGRQWPDADPSRARQGRQGSLCHAIAAAAADLARLLALGAAEPLPIPGPGGL